MSKTAKTYCIILPIQKKKKEEEEVVPHGLTVPAPSYSL